MMALVSQNVDSLKWSAQRGMMAKLADKPPIPTMGRRPSRGSDPSSRSSTRSSTRDSRQPSLPPRLEALEALKAQADSNEDALSQKLREVKNKECLRNALDTIVRTVRETGQTEWEVFQKIDADGSGQLSKQELLSALRKMGCKLMPVEMDAVLRVFDRDGSGGIDFMEFYEVIKNHEVQQSGGGVPMLSKAVNPLCGFEVGQRVKSLVQIWTKELSEARNDEVNPGAEVGTVIGAGATPGTVMVKFDRGGLLFSMKVKSIALKDNKSLRRQSSAASLLRSKRTTI
jgi:hypothetical protein